MILYHYYLILCTDGTIKISFTRPSFKIIKNAIVNAKIFAINGSVTHRDLSRWQKLGFGKYKGIKEIFNHKVNETFSFAQLGQNVNIKA